MFSEQGGSSVYSGSEAFGQVNVISLLHQKLKLAVLVFMCIGFYASVIFK